MNAAQRRKVWRRAKRLKGRTVVVRDVRWHGNIYGARWLKGEVLWAGKAGGHIEADVWLASGRGTVTVLSHKLREA